MKTGKPITTPLPDEMEPQASEKWALYRIICPIVDTSCHFSGLEPYFEYPQPTGPNSVIKVDIALLTEQKKPIWYIEAKKFARPIHRAMIEGYLRDDLMGVVSNGNNWIFVIMGKAFTVGPILDNSNKPIDAEIDRIIRLLSCKSIKQLLGLGDFKEETPLLVKNVNASTVHRQSAGKGKRLYAEKTTYTELAPALQQACKASIPDSMTALYLHKLMDSGLQISGGFLEVSEKRLIWWRAKSDRLVRIDLTSKQLSVLIAREIIDWIGIAKISARLKIHDKNTNMMQSFANTPLKVESLLPVFQYPIKG